MSVKCQRCGVVGTIVHGLAPLQAAGPGAYALVGMGTLFAGIIRAPMTSVFMIFEITQDYQILVPLMVANLISFSISRRFQTTPVYHALLQQDHVHLPSLETHPETPAWVAGDVMDLDCEFVPADDTVAALWAHASRNGAPAYLVGTPSQLVGVVSRERLAEAVNADILNEPVASLVDARLVHGHIDHPADIVLDRLAHSHGMLPIVSREHARRTLGVVTVDHIWRFMQRRRAAVAVQSAQPERSSGRLNRHHGKS